MQPSVICDKLGADKLIRICDELNSTQLKTTLRKGDVSTKAPSRMVSQKARRRLWSERLVRALERGNDELAQSLLYEWLLHHRRNLLILYLDRIGVKHQGGETEETFTRTVPAETLVEEALELAKEQDPVEVAAYVHFLDFHQESEVFLQSAALCGLLEGASLDEALRLHKEASTEPESEAAPVSSTEREPEAAPASSTEPEPMAAPEASASADEAQPGSDGSE